MGTPLVHRLLAAGYGVSVYNRHRAKAAALQSAGATVADNPSQLMKDTGVLIIMVSDDRAVADVFKGRNGLFDAGVTGRLVINMSTVSPGLNRELATICESRGNDFIDAPVSGSVKPAQEGQLVIMVGGTEKAFDRARPILQHLGKLVLRIGDLGAGNTAKLAINILLGIYAQGLAESLLFARRHGVKAEDFMAILNSGALANIFGKMKGEAILENNYKPAFAVKHIAKDLRLARAEGWHTPLAENAWQSYQQAEGKFGEEDMIAIYKQLSQA